MSIKQTRNLLLQTAAVFALSTGLSFAEDATNDGDTADGIVILPDVVTDANVDVGIGTGGAEVGVDVTTDVELIGEAPATNDETVPDVEPGQVVLSPTQFMDDQTANALAQWTLEDYQGASVYGDMGEVVGTVEKLAYDDGETVYLIIETSGRINPVGDGPRALPLANVSYDADMRGLALDAITIGTVEAMAPLDVEASGYTEISTDAQFVEMMNAKLNEN